MTQTETTPRKRFDRDHGTPEMQARRLMLVVNNATGKAGDPNMAFCELGRLCEQGLLDPDRGTARRMFDAGQTLLALWQAVFPQRGASTLGRFVPAAGGDFDVERAETDLKSLRAFFGPSRRHVFGCVLNCVAYDERPRGARLATLRDGLHLIIAWQKEKRE